MRGPRFAQIRRRRSALELAFKANPRSLAIAAQLNRRGHTVCKHRRNPCTVFCGVGWYDGEWRPIPKPVRVAFVCNLIDDVTHRPRRFPGNVGKLNSGPQPREYWPMDPLPRGWRLCNPPPTPGFTRLVRTHESPCVD